MFSYLFLLFEFLLFHFSCLVTAHIIIFKVPYHHLFVTTFLLVFLFPLQVLHGFVKYYYWKIKFLQVIFTIWLLILYFTYFLLLFSLIVFFITRSYIQFLYNMILSHIFIIITFYFLLIIIL